MAGVHSAATGVLDVESQEKWRFRHGNFLVARGATKRGPRTIGPNRRKSTLQEQQEISGFPAVHRRTRINWECGSYERAYSGNRDFLSRPALRYKPRSCRTSDGR